MGKLCQVLKKGHRHYVKCVNTEFFMICIFPYSDWMRIFTE